MVAGPILNNAKNHNRIENLYDKTTKFGPNFQYHYSLGNMIMYVLHYRNFLFYFTLFFTYLYTYICVCIFH